MMGVRGRRVFFDSWAFSVTGTEIKDAIRAWVRNDFICKWL